MSASPTPSPSPTQSHAMIIAAYVKALASADPSVNQRALAFAEPGSPAAEYANYLSFAGQTFQDAQITGISVSYTRRSDGAYVVCPTQNGHPGPCTTLDGFVFSPTGKIVWFEQDGNSVATRLAPGGTTASRNRVMANVVRGFATSASETTNLSVEVVISNESGQDMNISTSSTSYQRADGMTRQASIFVGPVMLAPNASGRYVFQFPDAGRGGTLNLNLGGAVSGSFSLGVKVN